MRTSEATAPLNEHLDWPGAGQVFRLRRRRVVGGRVSVETVCGITSLPPERADAKRLLSLSRGHWGIENRLPWVRDVTFREDECRVRHRGVAQVLAALRHAVLRLVRGLAFVLVVAALEYFAEHRDDAIDVVLGRIK